MLTDFRSSAACRFLSLLDIGIGGAISVFDGGGSFFTIV